MSTYTQILYQIVFSTKNRELTDNHPGNWVEHLRGLLKRLAGSFDELLTRRDDSPAGRDDRQSWLGELGGPLKLLRASFEELSGWLEGLQYGRDDNLAGRDVNRSWLDELRPWLNEKRARPNELFEGNKRVKNLLSEARAPRGQKLQPRATPGGTEN